MTIRTASVDESTPRGGLGEGAIHRLLGYRLAQAAVVTTRAFEREVGKSLDLRPVEFTILQLVHENPLAGPSHLSNALDISRPGVKQWLDRLEARKLLRRKPHETDGRAHRLELTREGVRLLGAAVERLLKADEELLRQLSTGEQHMLIELLKKVARLEAESPKVGTRTAHACHRGPSPAGPAPSEHRRPTGPSDKAPDTSPKPPATHGGRVRQP